MNFIDFIVFGFKILSIDNIEVNTWNEAVVIIEKYPNKTVPITVERSEEICMSDEFRSYQEWDSLAILSLLASIDEEYSVNINSTQLEKMKTVGDVYKFISDRG